MTGDGVAEFFQAVEASREEYEKCALFPLDQFDLADPLSREYLPELARVRAHREATLQKQKDDSTARMLADLAVDRANNPSSAAQDRWNPDEEEQGEEEEDGGELNIIDKSASHLPISGNCCSFSVLRSVLSCHAMPNNSSGILLAACRLLTGVDVACAVYDIPFWHPWVM